MTLWTIQPVEWYEKLLTEKVIFGIPDFIDFVNEFPRFNYAYRWMVEQMNVRIGAPPIPNILPIWAWYQHNNIDRRKPDLRSTGFLTKGTKGVRIEIEKKETEVLLSDFELWHYPLGYYKIDDSEDEAEHFYSLLEKENVKFGDNNCPLPIKEMIEKSWEKIFDMEYCPEYSAKPFSQKLIQGTFWSLSLDEVKKVDYFTAR